MTERPPRKRAPRPGEGRPSKYDPKYCDTLIQAARKGLSLTAAAGMIEVSRDTLNEWSHVHPEFSDAIKRHQGIRTMVLEQQMLSAKAGPTVTARIFALKNAAPAEWRERQEIVNSGDQTLTIKGGLPDLYLKKK